MGNTANATSAMYPYPCLGLLEQQTETKTYFLNCFFPKDLSSSYAFVFIGYGVFATADISRGDFLLEYVGDEISPDEGDSLPDQTYVYYYNIGSKQFWYDIICCIL